MNKFRLATALVVVFALSLSLSASAQKVSGTSYTTGLGLRLDLGNGGTLVGPSVKHFFDATNAGEAMVIFGNGSTVLGLEYSYNGAIANAAGLKWNIGVGPAFAFYRGGYNDVWIRPFAGLEFKIPDVPLDLGFDWRPIGVLTHGGDFEAGRFGLAFRFTLK